MAEKIEQCLQSSKQSSKQTKNTLLCEAGTGTGKTFAYLVPAILSSQQVIISTGTKNLQDQLYRKDLPLIAKMLEPVKQRQLNFSLLKGRSNYVCLYRLEKAREEAWYDEPMQLEIQSIQQQLEQTEFADIAEFTQVKEDSMTWPIVTSNSDNCLGNSCSFHDECYVLKAREQAFDADIIVVNHHLLMADLKLKTDALGELLPAAQTYIIDEAHQLPDIASHFFSRQISARQIKQLLQDSRKHIAQLSLPMPRFIALSDDIKRMLDDLFMVLNRYQQRGSWSAISESIKPLCDEIFYALRKLKQYLEATSSGLEKNSAELESCFKRSEQLLTNFELLTGSTPDNMIHWFECQGRSLMIQLTPMSVGEEFKQQLQATDAHWIFTSATLSIKSHNAMTTDSMSTQDKSEFDYFSRQLALDDFSVLKLDSPFDFASQAILYAPQNLPLPNDALYTSALIRSVLPIIQWLEGRTFILFTSYRAMAEAKEILQTMDFNLFVQGDAPRQQLVERFKQTKKAVLLGTSSFWEGVDVKGEALSCVIIDKLPFASPYEPILQARIKAMQAQGLNAFYQYQLPQAGIALKQGAGRLIRDIDDVGILVVADPRLFTKAYGHYLRETLPPMPIESDFRQLQKQFIDLQSRSSA
jgi:ATP-dependent DNA helicase DinG